MAHEGMIFIFGALTVSKSMRFMIRKLLKKIFRPVPVAARTLGLRIRIPLEAWMCVRFSLLFCPV
jgi:hypothetical protein